MKNPPIIIIGAGRSGTNILRDSICSLPGLETWPCDEINYIWRHGNLKKSTDRFTAEDARPEVRKYIASEFAKFRQSSGAEQVVEKTCANSLRVDFINETFPGARYIFITRNAYDVSSSAMVRWSAPLDLAYILKKARYVPLMDIPYYASKYFMNRLKKLFSKEKRLASWGPVYPGMKQDLRQLSLAEVCAKQWQACVEIAFEDLEKINPQQVYQMRYEDFVTEPVVQLKKVMSFLGRDVSDAELQEAVGSVTPRSIGNYKKHMDEATLKRLEVIVEPTMKKIHSGVTSE